MPALKARHSPAQGGGREAAATLGGCQIDISPERAAQAFCIVLSGLKRNPFYTQGSVARCRVLLHPGLYCAFGALDEIHRANINSTITNHQ